jgi:formylglycine-generating enzyme required for sulfatase activity
MGILGLGLGAAAGMVPLYGQGDVKGIRVVEVTTPGGEGFLYRESHALLLGNTSYRDRSWANLPQIPGELEALRAELVRQGFVIYGGGIHLDLTKKEMLDLVEEFVTEHGVGNRVADDRLLVFYSGHGESEGDRGFLVPVDAPGSQGDWDQFRKAVVELARVESWAKRIEAKHALFAFDSCFSGAVFTQKGNKEIPPHVTMGAAKPARQFLTAGSKDETVPAVSAFTPYFVRGIAGEADTGDRDGFVTFGELSEFVGSRVARAVGTHVQAGALPHPYDQGDVVFAFAAGQSPVLPMPPVSPGPFTNTLGMKFVPVPGTNVLMSIGETRVADFSAFITDSGYDYASGATPYTLDTDGWRQREGKGFSWKNPGFTQTANDPVTCVSWEDAQAFCKWLSKKEGRTYRLPADHEWSLAVRIGDRESATASPKDKDAKIEGVYPWGTQFPPPATAGNYAGSEAKTVTWPAEYSIIEGFRDGFARTSPAGSFPANQLGIYDLGGNVWEWCEDWYDSSQNYRVLRGGSWVDGTEVDLRSSRRVVGTPAGRHDHGGFRLVLEVGSGG